jgi:hypothetical protein
MHVSELDRNYCNFYVSTSISLNYVSYIMLKLHYFNGILLAILHLTICHAACVITGSHQPVRGRAV